MSQSKNLPRGSPGDEAGEGGSVPSAAGWAQEVGRIAVLVGTKPRWALL